MLVARLRDTWDTLYSTCNWHIRFYAMWYSKLLNVDRNWVWSVHFTENSKYQLYKIKSATAELFHPDGHSVRSERTRKVRATVLWDSCRKSSCVVCIYGRFTRISDMSVPYQYRPFSAPDTWEWFYLKYMWRCFCVGHGTDGTDTELTRHWYGTDTSLIRNWHGTDTELIRNWHVTDTCESAFNRWRCERKE
jgi:hypothetical protein